MIPILILTANLLFVPSPFALADDRIQERLRQMLDTPASVTGPVSLDLKSVTLAAMMRSDSFRSLLAKHLAIDTDRLEQESATDAFAFAQVRQEWNRNQPNSLFGTNRFDQTNVDIGIEKKLGTGTRMSLGLSEYRNDSEFGSFGNINTKVAGGRLTLSQSLWRDSFGSTTRNMIQAGKIKSEAKRLLIESEVEEWFIQLTQLYHQVWLAQRRIESTRSSLTRKERLAVLFERRKALGISEESEQIQIESAVTQTRLQLDEFERLLKKQWNLLVISLKLNEEDRRTDPMHIPVLLPPAVPASDTECSKPIDQNRDLRQIDQELKAMEIETRAAVDQTSPELSLDLGLSTNGSVLNSMDDFNSRWSNALRARNPAYTIGLSLRLPLDASREQAQILGSLSMASQLESRANDLKARLNSNLETICSEITMLDRHHQLYSNLEQDMKKRFQLEELRYKQARTTPFTVLQAGDELYASGLSLDQTLTERWNRHWTTKKINGTLFNELEGWIRQKTGRSFNEIANSRRTP